MTHGLWVGEIMINFIFISNRRRPLEHVKNGVEEGLNDDDDDDWRLDRVTREFSGCV